MVKYLLTLILLIFGLNLNAQINKIDLNTYNKSSNRIIEYTNWQLSNDGCYGCASFYWKVTRSSQMDINNQFRYDIWFYSNSVWPNGEQASTYVSDINLYVNGYKISYVPWILFKESYSNPLLSFYTSSYNPLILLTWGGKKIF